MAQADSVPSAIRPLLTGARSNPSTKSRLVSFSHSIDDLINQLVLGHDEAALIRHWGEIAALSENSTGNSKARWHYVIIGRIPVGSYAVAVCYATTVIYLGWYPWNFLSIGLLFVIRNESLRERAFVWCSSRVRMLIGLAPNTMKATFALAESRR